MKSLLVSATYFPPQTGGISRMMEEICFALGPEQVACLTGVPAVQPDSGRLARIRVYRRPTVFTAKNKVIQAGGLAFAFSEILVRDRPDVLQLCSCQEGYVGLFAEKWLRLPFVVYAHGNEVLDALRSSYTKPRTALARAAIVFANSRYTARLVLSAGARSEAVRVIPLGCDPERFKPNAANEEFRTKVLGSRAGSAVILTVGNVVERKGHDIVIKALSTVRSVVHDVTYVIVGDGPYRPSLEKLALDLGMRSHVVFAGKVSDEDLPRYYSLCDVFAMPSRERLDSNDVEGFGIVFLEAGAAAKPVLAGRSGGIEDAVIHGATGLLVEPSSVSDVAQALIQLLLDAPLRQKLGAQARNRVLREFTWDAVAAQVRSGLEQAVGSYRRK